MLIKDSFSFDLSFFILPNTEKQGNLTTKNEGYSCV